MKITSNRLKEIIKEELDAAEKMKEVQSPLRFVDPGEVDVDALVKKMQDQDASQPNRDPLHGFNFKETDSIYKKLTTVHQLLEEIATTTNEEILNIMNQRLKKLFSMLKGPELQVAYQIARDVQEKHPELKQMKLGLK